MKKVHEGSIFFLTPYGLDTLTLTLFLGGHQRLIEKSRDEERKPETMNIGCR